MAGENSDIPTQGEWEVLSMSASTLGLPQAKPEDSISPPQENEEPVQNEELPQQMGEELKDVEPLPQIFHEDLVSTDKDPNICVSHVDSSKKIVKVSWWKRQVTIGQPQPHKYNAMLSIALVAAVVGIAVLGHRWYRERNLNHQLRLELAAKEEKLSDVMQQVKEAMTGRRRIGVTKSSFF